MKYKVTINGRTYEVEVEAGEAMVVDEYEAYAPAPAAPAAAPAAAPTAAGEVVSSPMPGTIVRIEVSVGQTVKAGDTLLILEAMKMENEIASPKDGTIAEIVTTKGSSVETGTPLVVIA